MRQFTVESPPLVRLVNGAIQVYKGVSADEQERGGPEDEFQGAERPPAPASARGYGHRLALPPSPGAQYPARVRAFSFRPFSSATTAILW